MSELPPDPHADQTYTLILGDTANPDAVMEITAGQALDIAAGKAIAATSTVTEDDE